MMEDIKKGRVSCVLVKDLSRLGRNYLETGSYLEQVFPLYHVRFIAVNDRFDTLYESDPISIPISIPLKNIVNEAYARDISRKVCSAVSIRQREGRHGGGAAPYGYKKSKTASGKYEIDAEAAAVVRFIFQLRAQNYNCQDIVRMLNERGIKSPNAYRFEKGIFKDQRMRDVPWKSVTVQNLLRDEVYLGSMVRGKTHKALYKGERRRRVPRSEWIVIPGMHEPIISRELFYDMGKSVQSGGLIDGDRSIQEDCNEKI